MGHTPVRTDLGDSLPVDAFTNELPSRQSRTPPSFEDIYKKKIGPLQHYLLVPLFFASIGYAIVCARFSS